MGISRNYDWVNRQNIYQKMEVIKDKIYKYYWQSKYSWTPRRLYRDISSIRVDEPVFLLGNEGAGLTLISRMLRRNPCVVSPSGNYRYWAGNAEMHNIRAHDLPEKLQSPKVKLWALDDQIDNYRLHKKDATSNLAESFVETIKKIIRAYSININKARFVDKSQSYSLKTPFLWEVFGNSNPKFVVSVRDPYSMCWRDAREDNIGERWYRQFGENLKIEERVKYTSRHWANLYETILVDLCEYGSFKLVKFEEVLESPRDAVRSIFDYCELEFDDDYLPQPHHRLPPGSGNNKKWFPLRSNVNASYREQMPSWAVDIVEEHCGELAKRFNYRSP